MPLYYDVSRAFTTNGSAGTASPHLYLLTVANQTACKVSGCYVASRFGTAGGGQMRIQSNSGTVASGGTSTTPTPRDIRGAVACQTTAFNDASAITVGTTLITRVTVGFAQTGGMGGWVATEPSAAIVLNPNGASPKDLEFASVANSNSVTGDLTVEFSEG